MLLAPGLLGKRGVVNAVFREVKGKAVVHVFEGPSIIKRLWAFLLALCAAVFLLVIVGAGNGMSLRLLAAIRDLTFFVIWIAAWGWWVYLVRRDHREFRTHLANAATLDDLRRRYKHTAYALDHWTNIQMTSLPGRKLKIHSSTGHTPIIRGPRGAKGAFVQALQEIRVMAASYKPPRPKKKAKKTPKKRPVEATPAPKATWKRVTGAADLEARP